MGSGIMPFYEYRNHRIGTSIIKPDFIAHPLGLEKTDGTNIAYIPDSENRNYFVPDTLVAVTIEEIHARVLEMHHASPFGPLVGPAWTDEDAIAWIDSVIEEYIR
jgi:hypothetical protein